ncbi:MAG TPA: kelch repeat-containing protein [Vicinamibacterales bacterium]|nr:kelch repeat-containing protein [Vicinamibacterales bacterium]
MQPTLSNRLSVLLFLGLAGFCLADDSASGLLAAARQQPQPPSSTDQSNYDGQTVTQLPDGRQLIVGGSGAKGPVDTIRVRNPLTGDEAVLPIRLREARTGHTSTVLPDGSVVIIGGSDRAGRGVTLSERLDVVAGNLSSVTGLTSRVYHTATVLPDGRLLVAGGYSASGEVLATSEIWDPRTGRREVVAGSLVWPRRHHTAHVTADGQVKIAGGIGPDGTEVPDGELFSPATGFFEPVQEALPVEPETFVSGSLPPAGSIDVANDAAISVLFSNPVAPESVSGRTVRLSGPDGDLRATVVPVGDGRLAFVTPEKALNPSADYVLTIDGVISVSGLPLRTAAVSWKTRGTATEPAAGDSNAEDRPIQRRPDGRPESPWQQLPAVTAEPGVTAVAGQVLRLNGKPLADVTLEMEGRTTRTDSTGRFLLRVEVSQPSAWRELMIDGRSANKGGRTYGIFEVGVKVASAQTTVIPYTIWMPALDTAHAVSIPSPTTSEVVITTPRIPGLEVRLPPGTVIRDHDRNIVREISITPIPLDQPPFPLPAGLEVPVYFTIQPGGAYVYTSGINVPPGARLIYPNGLGFRKGKRIPFWRYDSDERGWRVYGEGTVTGTQIVPNAGLGVYEFLGAMVGDPNMVPGQGSSRGNEDNRDGEPVDTATGLFVRGVTDLALPDVLPIALKRTYRQNDSRSRAFGVGTSHDYEMFLVGNTWPYTYVEVILPDGGRLRYDRISPGFSFEDAVYEHTSTPTEFFKSRIHYSSSGDWDLTLKDGRVYTFPEAEGVTVPSQAAIIRIRDRFGNEVSLARASNGNLQRITSTNGRWIQLTYDSTNRVTQAQDNIGRTVLYTYDSIGRLWKVTDAAGGVTEHTYDSSHRMLTVKDPRGIVYLTNEYDPAGRVIRQTQADSGTFQFDYTIDGTGTITQTDVTDPRGTVRRIVFNGAGYTLSDTRAFGTPLAQTTTYVRQANTNLPLSITDSLGRKTTYTYDSAGNVLSLTRLADTPQAVTSSFTYEPVFHQLATVTDPLGRITSFAYDTRGNLLRRTNPLGHVMIVKYDTAGRPLSVTDSVGGTTQVSYTGGDATGITDPLGNNSQQVFDGAGRLISTVNALGEATTYTYNSLDEVTTITDSLGGVTEITHDANRNVLSTRDARMNTVAYTYDAMNRMASRVDQLSRTETYIYDGNSNLVQATDRKNQTTSFDYDELNRLTVATHADTSTLTYGYDSGNRMTQTLDSMTGAITRSFDLLDRLIAETTPAGTVSYSYDPVGRRISMTTTGQGVVNYQHDDADNLVAVTQGSLSVSFAYDSAGRRVAQTLPNGVTVGYGYDAASRISDLTYSRPSDQLGSLSYGYDPVGRIRAVGGSWARVGLPEALVSAAYDDANQLTNWGGVPAHNDLNGNMVSLGSTTYTWNARNQLTGVSGGSSATFLYDGMGRRQSKTVEGTTTTVLYDGLNIAQESADGVTHSLLTGFRLDEVYSRSSATASKSFLVDGLGSAIALTSSMGDVETAYTYEPFGKATFSGAIDSNPFQFTGRENDGTGLLAYRSRYYDPSRQRFLSEDPLRFAFEPVTPQARGALRQGLIAEGINSYAYVRNSPTNFVDPLGLSAQCAQKARSALVNCLLAFTAVWYVGVELPAFLSCITASSPAHVPTGTTVLAVAACFYGLHHGPMGTLARIYAAAAAAACGGVYESTYGSCERCPE